VEATSALGLIDTRISVKASPPVSVKGTLVTISGKLENNLMGNWLGLGDKQVTISLDNSTLATVTTMNDGSYSYSFTPPVGTHVVTVYYPGDWLYNSCSASTSIQVTEPTQYAGTLLQKYAWIILLGLGLGVGAVIAFELPHLLKKP
jgi:hypothetical protein